MYFVDEQYVAVFQSGEQSRQVARFVDHRAGGGAQVYAQFRGDDPRQSSLAQSGRTVQQDMVQCFGALVGGADEDFEVGQYLGLSGEIVESERAESFSYSRSSGVSNRS